MRATTLLATATIAPVLLLASPAQAQDDASAPEVFTNVMNCRAITDDAARLTCFDAAVGELESAQANEELVVMSRDQVKETRRGLFGFSLPKVKLFGGGDEDEVSELTSTIASFSGSTGRYVVKLEDGAVWAQTDGAYVNRPKVGEEIVISKAAFGSYFARIDGGVAFRIKRRN